MVDLAHHVTPLLIVRLLQAFYDILKCLKVTSKRDFDAFFVCHALNYWSEMLNISKGPHLVKISLMVPKLASFDNYFDFLEIKWLLLHDLSE